LADLSQTLTSSIGLRHAKTAPETGAIGLKYQDRVGVRTISSSGTIPSVLSSETETGEVAVADGDTAAGGQKAVDGSHQTAEQGAGGQEADGCSLGHVCPLFLMRNHSAS